MLQTVKNLPAVQETWFDCWVVKIPWRREWLPTPVFLPGKSHGQRSLAVCGPWGLKELDTIELIFSFPHFHCCWVPPKVPLATPQRGFSETGPMCVPYQPWLEYESQGCCWMAVLVSPGGDLPLNSCKAWSSHVTSWSQSPHLLNAYDSSSHLIGL